MPAMATSCFQNACKRIHGWLQANFFLSDWGPNSQVPTLFNLILPEFGGLSSHEFEGVQRLGRERYFIPHYCLVELLFFTERPRITNSETRI